jgi:hypothetical protein
VDNVAALAIERVLLKDLTGLILANCEPSNLSDQELESVAGESAEVKEQRNEAVHRIAALETVIKTCRQYKSINHSTPQRGVPVQSNGSSSAGVTGPDTSNDGDSDVYSRTSEALSKRHIDETQAFGDISDPDSPTTAKPTRSIDHNEQSPPSADSGSSSEFRSAKSNGSTNIPLSSMSIGSPGQHNSKAAWRLGYKSASRKKKSLAALLSDSE